MNIPDFGLAVRVQKQITLSIRLGDEGVWTQTFGDVEGQPFTIVIAAGKGIAALQSVLDQGSATDPRSTL